LALTIASARSTAAVQYDFGQEGFAITSVGARDGSLDSRSNAQGVVFFSVSADTPYALSGFFNAIDPTAKAVGMSVTLTDLGTSAVLFHNEQSIFGEPNESFIVGQTQGNSANALAGSLHGLLQAGHGYRLNYGNSLYAANSGQAATAMGHFKLAFMPEPSSAVMALLALSTLLSCRSRRQRVGNPRGGAGALGGYDSVGAEAAH